MCVSYVIDEHKRRMISKAAGRGRVQPSYLSFVLSLHLDDYVVMETDKIRASQEFCDSNSLPVVQPKAGIKGCEACE